MKPSTLQNGFLYGDLTYVIRKALFAVHNEIGMYGKEKQYSNKVEEKFQEMGLKFKKEVRIGDSGNIADFTVEDKILIELKAKPFLTQDDYQQTQRYLQVLNFKLGILVNFRSKYLSPKRVLNSSNL